MYRTVFFNFYTMLYGNVGISVIMALPVPLELVPNSGLPRHVDRRKCCQLSSTDDCRLIITEHDGHDAVHRAGPFAAAEIFLKHWNFKRMIYCRTSGEHLCESVSQ